MSLKKKNKTDKALKKIGVNSIFLKNELIRIPQITITETLNLNPKE